MAADATPVSPFDARRPVDTTNSPQNVAGLTELPTLVHENPQSANLSIPTTEQHLAIAANVDAIYAEPPTPWLRQNAVLEYAALA